MKSGALGRCLSGDASPRPLAYLPGTAKTPKRPRVWEVRDIVAMVEAAEAAEGPKERGSYKPRQPIPDPA